MKNKSRKPVTYDDMRRMSADEKMKRVDFFVEADTFSREQLRIKYGCSNRADDPAWLDDGEGFGKTIGNIGLLPDKPVTIHFNFAAIGDKWVCFYRAISRYVDWDMIESYIDKNWPVKYDNGTRVARCDASNFHSCWNFCKEKSFENIGAINKGWFKQMFKEVAEDVSNSEDVEDIEITSTDKEVKITFSIDCGRYGLHRQNEIKIRKDRVIMDLAEIVEGGDLEYGLKRKIEEQIR